MDITYDKPVDFVNLSNYAKGIYHLDPTGKIAREKDYRQIKKMIEETVGKKLEVNDSEDIYSSVEDLQKFLIAIFISDEISVFHSYLESEEQFLSHAEMPKRYYVLEDQIKEYEKKIDTFIERNHVKHQKSKFRTCKNCGSSINKDFIVEDSEKRHCPVCDTDMRTPSEQEQLGSLLSKIDKWKQEQDAIVKKAVMMRPMISLWIYKEEY